MFSLDKIRASIVSEGLDGWLFCNFHHRDELADRVLEINKGTTNSRWWFYAIPAQGEPVKICHAIEAGILDSLPGTKRLYSSRDARISELSALPRGTWGMNISDTISVISTVDWGTVETVRASGLLVKSAEGLIQRLLGTLEPSAIESHERAGKALYEIVANTWEAISRAHESKTKITEYEVQRKILSQFEELRMVTDHPPIVAAGVNSSDPHYEPTEKESAVFSEGDIIQLDMWAKFDGSGEIYADISWVGVFASSPTDTQKKAFADLIEGRDLAVHFVADSLSNGSAPSGRDVDAETRAYFIRKGYEKALRHRLGHGIDVDVHGSGANLDSIEFPDSRKLVEGACFSIEPGIYLGEWGMRTEIDAYIKGSKITVSGGVPQKELLVCR